MSPHPHPMVYIFRSLFVLRAYVLNEFLTAKLLKQGNRYHKIRKALLNSTTHTHTLNIGLKTLLKQGISEPVFYDDLVYRFTRIFGKPNFSGQSKKIIIKRYKKLYITWIPCNGLHF